MTSLTTTRRYGLPLLAAALILAFGAAGASASVPVTRYAEPDGDGPAPSCPKTNPCDIQAAIGAVLDQDTVIALPGTYTLPPGTSLSPGQAITLRGLGTGTRPKIVSSGSPAVILSTPGSALRDVRLEATNSPNDVLEFYGPGSVDRVEVVGKGTTFNGAFLHNGTVRNSVIAYNGTNLNATAITTGGSTNSFRNDTAVCITAGCYAFYIADQSADAVEDVTIVNTIARTVDSTPPFLLTDNDGAAHDVDVSVVSSDYDVAPVGSPPDVEYFPGAGNITAAPIFGNVTGLDFRERPGSPTINKGANATANGALDSFGGPRVVGGRIDIGADEALDPKGLLKLGGNKKIKRKRSLKVPVSCGASACNISGAARVVLPGKRRAIVIGTRNSSAKLSPGEDGELVFKLKKKNYKKLKRAKGGTFNVVASFSAPLGFSGTSDRTYKFKK